MHGEITMETPSSSIAECNEQSQIQLHSKKKQKQLEYAIYLGDVISYSPTYGLASGNRELLSHR